MFHIFDFSSETTERNSTKLDMKQDLNVLYQCCGVFFWLIGKTRWPPNLWLAETFLTSLKPLIGIQWNLTGRDLNVLYQVCVFRADRKNNMAALTSDWLRHFWLLIRNRWTEFNETWQEARSQRPLTSLCSSGRSEKQGDLPGLWLAETFSTSPQTGLCFSGQSEKQDPPRPLIHWDIFDFSCETTEQNSTKLTGSKTSTSTSSTNFVFFGPIGKTRWPHWLWIGWDILDFSEEPLNWIQRNLMGNKILTSSTSTRFVSFGPIGKTRWLANPSKKALSGARYVALLVPCFKLLAVCNCELIIKKMKNWTLFDGTESDYINR